MSDKETEERMLAAAEAMVNATGLTVSLEHLSLEDVIREAGVARSAVYRRWPYKDLFFSDLLRALAKGGSPADFGSEASLRGIVRAVLDRTELLGTEEGRAAVFAEMLRANRDFEQVRESSTWRTYLALHATFLSLDDGPLRTDVQAALAETERGFVERIAASHRMLAELLGYRIRPEMGAGFEELATLLNATFRGLLLMSPTVPELGVVTLRAKPFGAWEEAEWSHAAIAVAAIETAFLEPDPGVEWTPARIAEVSDALRRLAEGR
ncbi:TetR/AcrR family transcriptional regulator [Glycomyces sp. NPDC048151]|uniref:TetR/AcrR family transcriptional regulator n=1 Tax=Glycomyces sp. NPDC048151 TaxID=3364002 RepID=UPI003713CA5A